MKIGRNKLKKNSSDAPGDCAWLIEKLRTCNDEELLNVLCTTSLETWSYGKCELHHWVDVLDRFDSILEAATAREDGQWVLPCNLPENAPMHDLVIWVLHFTTLLVEHSFSRHLYSSVEHLIKLLSSSSMSTVLSVLNLLYMFSKRSNYITRIPSGLKDTLLSRLISLAESWGGKENGYGLAQCCQDLPLSSYPKGSTTLHYEFYKENVTDDGKSPVHLKTANTACVIHIENVETLGESPSKIMERLVVEHDVPSDQQMELYTHLRLACNFGQYETRLQCVQARLQAMSILVYCNALQENAYSVLYSGLLEEFVDVLELQDPKLTEIKAATLRTLTSIIHLERQPNFPKLTTIIDVTGAASYHGFLPVLVRSCISTLTSTTPLEANPFPAPLATSLFSFLYHLASYETGGDALVSCGMMEALLTVVGWIGTEPDHITFVTRAVRVIDLITNLDMNAFQTHGGLNTFIKRLEFEVDQCRKDQPFVIQVPSRTTVNVSENADTEMAPPTEEIQESSLSPMDVADTSPQASTSQLNVEVSNVPVPTKTTCLPQRAALLKSMLNFLKKDNQDPGFSESMRHLMEGSLPHSLKHIISNAEYYGPSLFLLATDVVTVYVFGEPSLLSSLQDNGLTDVVLHALLVKDVPATKEVLGSLPNVFSALCLNSRGLESFVVCKPFQRLFKVLLSPDYLPAMRRRRSSEPMGDTASNLGTAMDELMRHQPSLKTEAMKAIVMLLQEVNNLGHDSHYVCWKTTSKAEPCQTTAPHTTSENSSDEEEEDDDEATQTTNPGSATISNENTTEEPPCDKKTVPLVDYVLNVMKFIDAILSNNSTDDHCKEFVLQKGLNPLLGILGLPNLPIDFAVSQACQSVSSVCKSILNLAHESDVLKEGLVWLNQHLTDLAPLHEPIPYPGGSVLLKELMSASNPAEAVNSAQATPLLHTLSAIHSYITMFVLVCRTSQAEIRQLAVKQWASPLGLKVLNGLSKLYTTLVAESTILFAVCSEEQGTDKDEAKSNSAENKASVAGTSGNLPMDIAELEAVSYSPLTRYSFIGGPFDAAANKTLASQQQLKLFKPLLSTASRLGKSLAELFSLLVKLCVGSPLRQRRGQQFTTAPTAPTPAAGLVASSLSHVLYSGLSWSPTPGRNLCKFRRTFLVCSIRFSSPMLFDEKKMPYHLMLQNFVKSQGLDAFFDIFYWALSTYIEPGSSEGQEDVSEGVEEFLDTWLYLLEKLVNPKTILESPHSLPTKKPFCPLHFLIHVQKRAFNAVMKLWNRKPIKTYGVKISEAVLVILCYIIKGESIIEEKLAKLEKTPETVTTNTETASTSQAAPMDTTTEQPFDLSLPLFSSTVPVVIPSANAETVAPVESEGTAQRSGSTDPVPPTPGLEGNQSASILDLLESTPMLLDDWHPASSSSSAPANTNPLEASIEIIAPRTPGAVMDDDIAVAPTPPPPPPPPPPPAPGAPVIPGSRWPESPFVNDPNLQSLLDMGFPEERCLQAIYRYNNLEQATEFLLSRPDGDLELTDDHWLQTLSTSLGSLSKNATKTTPDDVMMFAGEKPISKAKLEEFCSGILEGCLDQLEGQPQLVYKVCELLTTCVARNGKDWQQKLLSTLMDQVIVLATELKLIATQSTCADTAKYLCQSESANKFGVRLHLVALLFEEIKTGSAEALDGSKLPETLIDLVCYTEDVLSKNPQVITQIETSPEEKKDKKEKDQKQSLKWLAPALLLLDLYEKFSVAQQRRAAVQKVTNHTWKWFNVDAFRWYPYSAGNNKTINDAYWAGETSVRITDGRKKYMIQFHSMLQVNEESWNRKPIMISIKNSCVAEEKKKFLEKEGKKDNSKESKSVDQPLELTKKKKSEELMECENQNVETVTEKQTANLLMVPGFTDDQQTKMIRACVGYMKLGVEPDTLNALMRISLRMTRDWAHACLFSNLGGIRILLGLTDKSSFWGYQTLAALLMRHVLEEPTTLMNTMRKVLRYSVSSSGSMRSKEMHSLLRSLAPAACRNTSMFSELIKLYLRVDTSAAVKRNISTNPEDESLMMRTISTKVVGFSHISSLESDSEKTEPQQLIYDLLEALTQEIETTNTTTTTTAATPLTVSGPTFSTSSTHGRQLNLSRSSSANDMVVQDMDDQSPMESDASKVLGSETKAETEEQATKRKPLIGRAVICKLLAEFVRSYAGVAKLITEHQFVGGVTTNVKEDCSALSYLLDLLVTGSDTEVSSYIKVLIAALASCNHSVDAQTHLVMEVKNSLSKVVVLAESLDKHTKIQAVVSLIGTMMDSCPAQINQPMTSCYHKQQPGMNNIVRIMIKKSLITDLARIPHCLDLASPNLPSTINVVLKPLETVLRIANTPSMVSVSSSKKKGSNSEGVSQPSENVTTNSEATRAQGEENAEDPENTEHDLSQAGETMEPTSEVQTEDTVPLTSEDNGLDEIIGELLGENRSNSGRISSSDQGIHASVTYVIGDDTPMDTEDTLHDSRMVSHSDSQFLDDNDPNNDDSSDSSDDDHDAEENEVDDDDDDDDDDVDGPDEDDDDDDDDEEDEEEGSVFDEGYEDLEEEYLPLPNDRDNANELYIPSYQRYISTIDTIIFGDRLSFSHHLNHNMNHFQICNGDGQVVVASTPNSTTGEAVSVPPHPLFQNPRDINAQGRLLSSRPGFRSRGLVRYQTGAPRTQNTTTNILQRLLGQTHREVLQLTSNLREVFIANGGYPQLSESEEFDAGDTSNNSSSNRNNNSLPSVPNALTRWMEEARVLEPDSMHDAVTEIKPMIMAVLEHYREIEQEEKDKKRKEMLAAKPKTSKLTEGDQTATSTTEQNSSTPTPPTFTASLIDSGPSMSMLEPEILANPESIARSLPSNTPPTFQELVTSDADTALTPVSGIPLMNFQSMTSQNSRTAVMTRTTSSLPETTTVPVSVEPQQPVASIDEGSPRSPQRLAMSNLSLIHEQLAQAADEDMCVSPPANVQSQIATEPPVSGGETATPQSEESPSNPLTTETTPIVTAAEGTSRVSNEYAAILGDIEIPEGVDPSFLAALPEDMRQEVIAEQLRIQQVRRASEALREHTSEAVSEVSPEFLAALPPSIQEELLAHQRQEQERQEGARASSDDPAAFIQNLPSNLRETVLADIEESQLSVLPPEVVQEAQRLRGRRERDSRHTEGLIRGAAGTSIQNILRNSARLGSRFMHSSNWPPWNLRQTTSANQNVAGHKLKGQQVLDHEAVSCLLILLFIDEPRINTTRLHRVIKFLCYYPPTRQWIIKTLLSIIDRCGNQSNTKYLTEKTDFNPSTSSDKELKPLSTPSWLSMGIETALGLKTNIFQLYKSSLGGKRTPSSGSNTIVLIHNQAAPLVCRHAVDLLISLAKLFPVQFLPASKECEESDPKRPSTSSGAVPKKSNTDLPDFWEILMKLDSISVSRKSKSFPKAHINTSSTNPTESDIEVTIENSPLGELISQLAHPVIRRSSSLTDKLLRLLALVSARLPDCTFYSSKNKKMSEKSIKGLEKLIGLAVQVLTSKSCSEEGLEDVTTLLLNLANGPPPSWELVLQLLLQGASTLGHTVTSHIAGLYSELEEFNSSHQTQTPEEQPITLDKSRKGTFTDRFTRQEVIITQSAKTKSPCEVQLPSMSYLTSKTSSQAFFLRTLKVIIQLRDIIRQSKNKEKDKRHYRAREQELVAALSLPSVAEEMVVEFGEETPAQNTGETVGASAPQPPPTAPSNQPMETSPEHSEASGSFEDMEVDQDQEEELKSLSFELGLESLWTTLSKCLIELGETPDTHAVLVLQPAVEAFFLVHAFAASSDKKSKTTANQETREAQLAHLEKEIAPLSPVPVSGDEDSRPDKKPTSESTANDDAQKFLAFAEMHRSVLNQILRQSTVHLADGPFGVLVDHTRLLDFDIKRKYFRTELERADDGMRKEDLAIHVRRENVFEDSFREIQRRTPEEWKNRFYIVFEGEEGQDAGGLLREWYMIISREIFNPMYALFCTSPGDRVTYMINPSSHCNSNHLSYFKFVGRVIAKAIYDNKLLECYFTRSFYKHILGKMVRVADMESEDYSFYQGLIYLIEHKIDDLGYDLTFSTEVQEFGVTEVRDLKPDGRNIPVTECTKMEYIRLVCQEKMTGAIRKQLNAFLEGFYDIIPKRLISIFNEQELELLLSGLPTIDIDDLKNNTEYHKYNANSLQIQWFWRALRSFDQAERAKLVQFVTGTSKVPLQGFAALEGMNGVQKFQIHKDERSTDRLPSAHTCFNQLDLPVYETYDKLRHYLLKAIVECSEGFGFA